MNGSPLFTGDAGSGESEIRRWILENDWLEAIVALPEHIRAVSWLNESASASFYLLKVEYVIRERFWTELLERAKQKTKLHANISPGQYGWIGTGAGKRGLGFNYVIRKHEANVELYIDRGQDSEKENKTIFDTLAASKSAIEAAFEGPLEWQRLEGKRACRIRYTIDIGGYLDENKWAEIQDAMIDAMIHLEKALKPHITKLEV